MRVRRIARFVGRLACALVVGVATLFLLAWIVGRVASDRYAWSQWLLWIPTPALLPAVVLGLAGTIGAVRTRRARRRGLMTWLAVLAIGTGYFAVHEHRMLRRAPAPEGLCFVHWNMTHLQAVDEHGTHLRALMAILGDVTLLVDAHGLWRSEALREAIDADTRLFLVGPVTVITRHPVLEARQLLRFESASVVLLRFDTTETLGRPLTVYAVDLPSDPRLPRFRNADRMRGMLDAIEAPAPDVVIGDMNVPRDSASLRRLFPQLRHAYDEAGHGYGGSFHRRFPLYHIDHTLLAPDFECTRYDLLDPGVGRHLMQRSFVRPRGSRRPPMLRFIVKVAVTTLLIVLIVETARRSTLVGAIIASLPVTSILAMIWLYADEADPAKIAQLSTSIFWLVLPSLVLFIVLPLLLRKHVAFYLSLVLACAATALAYGAILLVLGKLGVKL